MKASELLLEGLVKRLDARGIQHPDLVARGILADAKTNDAGEIMVGEQSMDNFIQATFNNQQGDQKNDKGGDKDQGQGKTDNATGGNGGAKDKKTTDQDNADFQAKLDRMAAGAFDLTDR